MAELVEVLFYDRIGPYNKGGLHMIEDGVFLRALLKSGKGDVVNPPDWTIEKADSAKQPKTEPAPIVPKTVKVPKAVLESIKKAEVKDGINTSTDQAVPVEAETSEQSGTDQGHREESSELPTESATSSSERFRELDSFIETSETDQAR